MVFFTAHPATTLPCAMAAVKAFGDYSRLLISWQMYYVMPLLRREWEIGNTINIIPIVASFKSLGIIICRDSSLSYELNIYSLMSLPKDTFQI